jgi:hypothetical protein
VLVTLVTRQPPEGSAVGCKEPGRTLSWQVAVDTYLLGWARPRGQHLLSGVAGVARGGWGGGFLVVHVILWAEYSVVGAFQGVEVIDSFHFGLCRFLGKKKEGV